MTAPAAIEVTGLSKSFGARPALSDVSFSVRAGECAGLLGPNGAGKTTLIHLLLGLLRPTAGAVRLLGLEMPQRRQAALRRVSFSSAYVQLPLSLTPRENLDIFGRLCGVAGAAAKSEALLSRFGLSEIADAPTRRLSSGQLSRLGLAKALVNDPEVLLLDEPTASMDPDAAQNTRTLLKDIQRERGLAILYTTHNMREAELMADRVLFLRRGRLAAEGTPKDLAELFEEADLEKVFLKLARQ